MLATLNKRQAEIIQATIDLVAENGLTGTTISQIAKRAHASPGIIYHYFETKDDIIHLVYETITAEYVAVMMAGFPAEAPWQARLKHIWLKTYTYFVENPHKATFHEQYKHSAYYTEGTERGADALYQPLVDSFIQETIQGNIRNLPFPALYTLSIGVALNIAKHQIAGVLEPDEAMLASLAEASCRALAIV
ncbi:MAG: TetR family transcriptional regulator [Anaerolineales bacterium]|nr:TetR family transcriptional regulator [Anaerolineales bacterium]